MQNMNWGDYEYFLAVARFGSALSASRQLGVNHTTISRRIAALEAGLGCRLFEKSKTGYRLTEDGMSIFSTVEAIEENVHKIGKRTLGRNHQAAGTVNVSISEVIYTNLIVPYLGDFCLSYPRIDLNFLLSDSVENLNQRSVDIALRLTDSPVIPPFLTEAKSRN